VTEVGALFVAGRMWSVCGRHTLCGKWAWLAGRGHCTASTPEWLAGRNVSVCFDWGCSSIFKCALKCLSDVWRGGTMGCASD